MARALISRFTASFIRSVSFLMPLLITFAMLGFCSRHADATIYYVSTTGTGNGSSWATAGTLQPIITAAHAGDQVWVKYGTYTGNFTATDGVAVYGHFAGTETSLTQRQLTNTAYATILDGNNNGTVYTILGSATGTNTLDGFTVQNGNNSGVYDTGTDTLIIANCAFTANFGIQGAGIADVYGTLTLTNSTFTSDQAQGYGGGGGGVSGTGPSCTITNCTFTDCYGGGGGAVDNDNTNIINCTFRNNNAILGGAVSLGGISTVTNCMFSGNSCTVYNEHGGGALLCYTATTVSQCVFTNNSTTSFGGAIDVVNAATISDCVFMNNSATNSGGGIYASGATAISDCTFGGLSASDANTPQAIYLQSAGDTSTTPPTPSIVKDNLSIGMGTTMTDPDGIDIDTGNSGDTSYATIANNTIVNTNVGINIATASGAISVANNIFYGDYGSLNDTGTAMFTSSHNDNDNNVSYYYQGVNPSASDLLSVDPKFVMNPNFGATPPSDGNLELAPGSPLIGVGDVSYVSSGDTDLNGNPREVNGKVDLGCYEASPVATMLTSISPASVTAGNAAFTLTAKGTGFVSGATLDWNGTALATTYVSATQLTATVPASLVATAGTASVTVVNPGASASNVLTFTITTPAATWTAAAVSAAPSGLSHILWTRSDGAAGLWTLNALGVQTATGPVYGPYPGWTAKAVATASDGTSRVLWTNVNGEAGVWTFNAADAETIIGTTYGPYAGWTAKSVGVAGDGTARVLWTNTDGMAGVWTLNAADAETVIGKTYGPYSGWSAQSLATDPGGISRVLWDNTNGMAGVWTFNAADIETTIGTTYGPYAGWTAKAVGASGDGTARVLWTNTNGMAGVWSFSAADAETVVGATYGPYAGYSAAALGVSSDGTSRVLWDDTSRAAGVWTFGANDIETVIGTVYGPY